MTSSRCEPCQSNQDLLPPLSNNNNINVDKSPIVVHTTETCNYMLEPKLLNFCLKPSSTAQIEDNRSVAGEVNVFLAWSLLLSHLSSLPSTSPAREKLVQYVQDSANSTILDCLFQHIPLELCMVHILRKKELPAGLSEAATATTHAIKTRLLLFSIESLWAVDLVKMASLACAILGLMLRVLPANVRVLPACAIFGLMLRVLCRIPLAC